MSSRVVWAVESFREPEFKQILEGSVVGLTIGNFDGVHLGHAAIFKSLQLKVRDLSRLRGKPDVSCLLTFFPHPRRALSELTREQLNRNPETCYLTTLRTKISLLKQFGFDYIAVQKFDVNFRSISAQGFIEEIVWGTFKSDLVSVGADWAFGRERQGSINLLRQLSNQLGYQVDLVEQTEVDGLRVSSSAMRQAITNGDFPLYRRLSGRNFSVCGKVVHGSKVGRKLGCPTANLSVPSQILPPQGVYSGSAVVGGVRFKAAISLGTRQVFESHGSQVLEAHFLSDTWLELYGQQIDLEFNSKLREQLKFASAEELVDAMQKDVELVRSSDF